MKKRKVTLDWDVVERLYGIYQQRGYPYGKNRRKRDKWIRLFVEQTLTKFIKMEKGKENNEDY